MDVRCNFMLKAEVFTLTSPSSAILLLKIASLTLSIAKKTALSAASPDVWASLQEETISVRIKIPRNLQCLPLWDIIQVFTAVKKIDLSLPPDLHTGKGLAPAPFPRVSPVAIYTPKFLPKYQLGKAYYVECREEIERNQTSYWIVRYLCETSEPDPGAKKTPTKSWVGLTGLNIMASYRFWFHLTWLKWALTLLRATRLSRCESQTKQN